MASAKENEHEKPIPTTVPKDSKDLQTMYVHGLMKGAQVGALVTPPCALAKQLYGGKFNLNRFLRANAVGTFVFGMPLGLGLTYARLTSVDGAGVQDRAFRIRHNVSQIQVDDYSIVGSVLGALITTTIFLRRASVLNTVVGGASLGIFGGVTTHIVKKWTKGDTDNTPSQMMEEVKDAIHDTKNR